MKTAEHSLTRETRASEGVRVVRVSGRVRAPAFVTGLPTREELGRWLGGGERQFVFNLSGLAFLDSASLGDLLACQKQARAGGGAVRAVLSPAQRRLFRAAKLDTLVEIFEDEESATAAARRDIARR